VADGGSGEDEGVGDAGARDDEGVAEDVGVGEGDGHVKLLAQKACTDCPGVLASALQVVGTGGGCVVTTAAPEQLAEG